jgi:hypothetical protein
MIKIEKKLNDGNLDVLRKRYYGISDDDLNKVIDNKDCKLFKIYDKEFNVSDIKVGDYIKWFSDFEEVLVFKMDDKGLWCGDDNSEYCRYKFNELKKLNKMRI